MTLEKRYFGLLLAGLVFLSAVGTPFAVDPLYAGYQTLRLGLLMALYLMVVNLPWKPSHIAWPFAIAMALQAVVSLPQFALGRSLGLAELGEVSVNATWPGTSVVMVGDQRWLRAYGLTQHPNLLGGCLMAMILIVTGYYLLRAGWIRLPLLIALGLGSGALLLTFSKGALLLGVPAALLALGLLQRDHRSRRDWRATWIALGALALLALLLTPLFLTDRFGSLFDLSQGTGFFRLKLWRSALAMIADYPLSGVGLDGFLYAYRSRYVLPSAWGELNLSHPHNLVLDAWTRLGLPGVIVVGGLLAAFGRAAWRRLHRTRRNRFRLGWRWRLVFQDGYVAYRRRYG
mgnify:CR=1 FL=1